MRYPKGEVTVQGEEALTYVRQRYGLPNGDLDRAERQRAVVKAILMKMLSLDVLANPVKFNDVMGSLGRHFTGLNYLDADKIWKGPHPEDGKPLVYTDDLPAGGPVNPSSLLAFHPVRPVVWSMLPPRST